jgi:hypothetical protein
VFQDDTELLRFFGNHYLRHNYLELIAKVRAMAPHSVDLINQPTLPWEYPITLGLRDGPNPPRIGYFYPVLGSPPPGPPADVVIDIGSQYPPEVIRHPQTRAVYRIADRIGDYTIYRPLAAGSEYAGHRLTDSGAWKPIPGASPSPPPICEHAVARYGIGAEPPAGH